MAKHKHHHHGQHLNKSARRVAHRKHGLSVDPDSTVIEHAKLIRKTGELIIDFVDGSTYSYGGCDKSDLRGLDEGGGEFFNSEIRE